MAFSVDVRMVDVKRIGARPEHRRKPTAGRRARRPNLGHFVGAILTFPHDTPLVRKSGDEIYCDPFGVGADLAARKAIAIARLIARAGLDRVDLGSQRSRAERRNDQSYIIGKDQSEFASEDWAVR